MICWALTDAAGNLRVFTKTELVGKSVKASPPKDRAVLAAMAVIRYSPTVTEPKVATATPAPAMAEIAL